MLEKFANYLKNKKHLSSNTIRVYLARLRWVDPINNSIAKIKKVLLKSNYKPQTLSLTKIALVQFYSFYKLNKELRELSLIKLPTEQPKPKPKIALAKEEITKCLEINQQDSKADVQTKLILMFIASTGIRGSEIYNLKFIEDELYVVNGKGKKTRMIYYNKSITNQINFNKLPSLSYLRKKLKLFFNNNFISLHTLRHSFATHCLKQTNGEINYGVLKFVSNQLGHSNIDTTLKYLQLSKYDANEIFNQFWKID